MLKNQLSLFLTFFMLEVKKNLKKNKYNTVQISIQKISNYLYKIIL